MKLKFIKMKLLLSFSFCFYLFFNNINLYSQQYIQTTNDTVKGMFNILKIKHCNSAYIIDAKNLKNNYLYRIVSLQKKEKKCNKIKVGNEIYLKIYSYFNITNFVPDMNIINVIKIENTTISVPSEEWTSNIYLTNDLKGLCYKLIE